MPGEVRGPRVVVEASPVALLSMLFCSGGCALLYQVTWLRELRLVFGASTPATAAVLAIFMGGLGVGSAWLGPGADRDPRPLRRYAALEIGIALIAVVTPTLLWLVRQTYVAAGGTAALGPLGGTLLRIALAVLVLGPPAILMGGTLPAAARALESDADRGRGRIALLYGANTLGAVTGALLATFVLLEVLGARATIWVAAGANLIVGLVALVVASSMAPRPELRLTGGARDAADAPGRERASLPHALVLPAAAAVGFVFFLMEMVWYRMLYPLLGGSTYSFGIILATALLGVGLGGIVYGRVFGGRRPSAALLAVTCALEALCIAAPFALGDRLAVLAVLLRPLGQFEFAGHVAGWAFLTSIVVLPAALVAGFQFPLLVGLLGEGREDVGRHTGAAYAWNTAGAIAGSLAGGFGLLPALTAPGVWRLVPVLLVLLGAIGLAASRRRPGSGRAAIVAVPLAIAAILLIAIPAGPTAAWRHSSIGAGRVKLDALRSRNDVRHWQHEKRRSISWESEGRESSIAINHEFGVSLMVGGRSDGNIALDAGTQVMAGMIGAVLHPRPRRALVIGLGTGTTAGWFGRVPSIERVDVVELEPAVAHVARVCAPANQDVLSNPRVHLKIGDGREFLLTSRDRYDLIFSEPSNPYRAGVASLFTSEFYRAAARRLTGDGLLLQWVQAYETDYESLGTIYATLHGVFPCVETWATQGADLLLVASFKPIVRGADELRARIREEPFRSALQVGWRTSSLEGVLAHFVGNPGFGAFLSEAAKERPINTDDRTVLEYRFARGAGRETRVTVTDLWDLAFLRGEHLPEWVGGEIDASEVMVQRASIFAREESSPVLPAPDHPLYPRIEAMKRYVEGDYPGALPYCRQAEGDPHDLTQLAMVADVLAEAGDPRALRAIEAMHAQRPAEAGLIRARYHLRRHEARAASAAFERALLECRHDPWTWPLVAGRILPLAGAIADADPGAPARRVFTALGEPFAADFAHDLRLRARFDVARRIEKDAPGDLTREVLDRLGEPSPWSRAVLETRVASAAANGDARLAEARRELAEFLRDEPSASPIDAHPLLRGVPGVPPALPADRMRP